MSSGIEVFRMLSVQGASVALSIFSFESMLSVCMPSSGYLRKTLVMHAGAGYGNFRVLWNVIINISCTESKH